LSNEEKTNDYENFEKGMIYMKILKKGGSREKGEGGNEIHAPCACVTDFIYGGTFNFNNPQSSQKRQRDDSGLQIAKTKYKRILPLSFSVNVSVPIKKR
jgi:hypothetical protein